MFVNLKKTQQFETEEGIHKTSKVDIPIGVNVKIHPRDINKLYKTDIPATTLDKHIKNILTNTDYILEEQYKAVTTRGEEVKRQFTFGSRGEGLKIKATLTREKDSYHTSTKTVLITRDYIVTLDIIEDKTVHSKKARDIVSTRRKR